MVTRTQPELRQLMEDRFGPDLADWSFTCPSCGDASSFRDFRAALAVQPRTNRDGEAVVASDIAGQECIGRTLGVLTTTDAEWARLRSAGQVRGCSWVAFGLFRGPDFVRLADGREVPCFPVSDAVP